MLNKNTGLLILLFFFSFYVQAQHPVVQRVIDRDPQLLIERQPNENSYIVAIAIDKNTRTSYLLSRYGFVADSVAVSPADLQLITQKKVSAFAHYQALMAKMTEITETARQQIRNSGSLDKKWTFAPVIKNMVPELDTTKGHLQKLLLLDNFAREFYISAFLSTHLKTKNNTSEPDSLPGAPGTFQYLGDSTVYFSSNLLAELQKAVMYHNKNILVFYNINNVALDTITVSIPVQARLEREKTDVFLVYRGWLETQKITIAEKRTFLADMAQKPILQLAVNKNAKQAVLKVLAENKREAEEVEQKLNKVSRPGSNNITRLLEQQTQYVPENRFLLESLGMGYTTQFNRGTKKYELTDHRGNVMGVVTDRKLPADAGAYNLQCYPCFPGLPCPPCEYVLTNPNPDGITDYYTADVAQVTDYFPFGMSMTGRKFSNGEPHRFGFQTQEKSDEIAVGGNHATAMYWEYETRLGRRWNQDPKPNFSISNYAVLSNNPLLFVDVLGDSIKADFLKIGTIETYSEKALKALLSTKEGYNYLAKFAAKGQTLYGYTFNKDGEYHSKGIDLAYSNFSFTTDDISTGRVYNMPRGEQQEQTVNGRLKIDIKINYFARSDMLTEEFKKDYEDAVKNNNVKKMDNVLLMTKVQTIAHETLIHANFMVMRKLGLSFTEYTGSGYNKDHYTEHMNTQNKVKTLWNTQGFSILNQLNKSKNTGWNSNRVWKSMWDFQY